MVRTLKDGTTYRTRDGSVGVYCQILNELVFWNSEFLMPISTYVENDRFQMLPVDPNTPHRLVIGDWVNERSFIGREFCRFGSRYHIIDCSNGAALVVDASRNLSVIGLNFDELVEVEPRFEMDPVTDFKNGCLTFRHSAGIVGRIDKNWCLKVGYIRLHGHTNGLFGQLVDSDTELGFDGFGVPTKDTLYRWRDHYLQIEDYTFGLGFSVKSLDGDEFLVNEPLEPIANEDLPPDIKRRWIERLLK